MASGKAPVDEAVLDKDVKKPPATKVCNIWLSSKILGRQKTDVINLEFKQRGQTI